VATAGAAAAAQLEVQLELQLEGKSAATVRTSTSSGFILVGTSILYAGFALLVYPEMMSTSLASTHFATLLLTRTCVARWVSFNMTTIGTKLSTKITFSLVTWMMTRK